MIKMNVRNEQQAQTDIILNCHRYHESFSCYVTWETCKQI